MTDFVYVTIKELRDEGVEEAQHPDNRVYNRILDASNQINTTTKQIFVPVEESIRLNGNGDKLIHHPQLIPIIKITEAYLVASDGSEDSLDLTAFEIEDRLILYLNNKFKYGLRNYRFVGVFGWIENTKNVETETTAHILPDDTEIVLDDVSKLDPGDVLLINGYYFLTHDINYTESKALIDKARLKVTQIDSGATVKCYGAPPRLIKKVAKQLTILNLPDMSSEQAQDSEEELRLKSEKTDNYSYTYFKPEESGGLSATGDYKIDELLAQFMPPPMIGVV